MDAFLIVAVLGLLVIAAAAALAPKIGVANPLLLVVLGFAVSLVPAVPEIVVEPEWILAGVLPPLLYSASVSMPSMDFRREFTAIGGLSVVLVVLSSLVLGVFFWWVIPDLSLPWAIALGAIVSPTDAVATSIVKRLGVAPRVVTMLEGESLLNDATALVLLRSAIAGAAASVSLWSVVGSFVFSVVVASVIGVIVGMLNLAVRSRVTDSTVNTVISFTIPFIAAVPAELLGASGLVAAVVAGLVTGAGAAAKLSPQHRLSESQNWHTIELLLEGAVFLIMGLELTKVVGDVVDDHGGIVPALLTTAGALVITVLVRAAYVGPLVLSMRRRAERKERMRPKIDKVTQRLAEPGAAEAFIAARGARGPRTAGALERFTARLRRMSADLDFFLSRPVGWREGTVVVWAGMRGVVTLAAAQTLPENTPSRSTLIFIAFVVAAASLVLQGGTLGAVIRGVRPHVEDPADAAEERRRLRELVDEAASTVPRTDGDGLPAAGYALKVIDAQRAALLAARTDGLFTSQSLNSALEVLDADQIRLELRGAATER
ncbi:sodium/proton antiporter, CPA1 family [Paramicrobacterium humi]|uniref:Sodium/proton antiporter, CPA1 family n=1 Tax=Paramicrobacterium humi TaxID=640635 RepID=A0A1H4IQY2_9MICO|nr:sodium:proton antiporter [Microbacterium humi]SEB36393.1 sodium/proton antiporter, CPA1 family [Microbacterium humi]